MAISDLLVRYGWLILGALVGSAWLLLRALQRSEPMQVRLDQMLLALPIFGMLVQKSCVARWARTLSAMFAAGVPLVEALDSVGGACGNAVYASATQKIRSEISTGQGLSAAMANAKVFPAMLLQMCAIGEESGAIDSMLGKAAEVYEAEVDDMLSGLASLIEPVIIVLLGLVIGSIVVAMYLPIFKLGQVV
jgi:type IV pilus assembly protein PilC